MNEEASMALAEALTSASKALERARRRTEEIIPILRTLNRPQDGVRVDELLQAAATLETINRSIRKMNT